MTRFLQFVLTLIVLFTCITAHAVDADVKRFQDIASRLDIGGDLFLVVNTGRWLDKVLERFEQPESDLPPSTVEEREFRSLAADVRRFVTRHGISSLQGVGMSSVPMQGGGSKLKIFLLRDSHDANLPFWRGLFGWQPRRMLSLDFLPANTQFVLAATPDPSGLWGLLQSAYEELQPPSQVDLIQQLDVTATNLTGVSAKTFLEGIRDEILISARATPVETGYTWEWMVVIGTGEKQLFKTVQSLLQTSGHELEEVEISGRRMQRVKQRSGANGSTSNVYAFASIPGFFVFGNSPLIVEDALHSQRHRSGLVSRPVFTDAFRGQNMVNNGILYVSQTGAEVLHSLHVSNASSSLPENRSTFSYKLLEELSGEGLQKSEFALTFSNWKQGIMISGRSGVEGAAIGSWMGSFPWRLWLRLPEMISRYIPDEIE